MPARATRGRRMFQMISQLVDEMPPAGPIIAPNATEAASSTNAAGNHHRRTTR